MVQGSFVLSAYRKKDEAEKRRVNYRQTNMRYAVVVIAIFVVFGCEYCFDNPSALQTQIEENYFDKQKTIMGEAQFNLLYSLYAFPNIIIPLIGGILIDKIGARVVLIITAAFCVLGQLIFTVGGQQNIFTIMLVGRVVFGIGGEVLHASQNTLVSNWFKPNQLSMVLGICLSFPKMGSSLNSYVSAAVGQEFASSHPDTFYNVAVPAVIGFGLMVISLILSIVLAYIDRLTEKRQSTIHQSGLISSKSQEVIAAKRRSHKSEVKIVEASHIDADEKAEVPEEGGHLNLKAIGKLPLTFWLIVVISMLAEALFIPFLDNGNKYYIAVFSIEANEAGIYLILPYCASSLFVVILGYLVDRVGKRSYILIMSCSFITFTYLFMMFLEANQAMRNTAFVRWIPSFLLGICISIFCAIIVPTIPMLVPPKLLGTGFGIMEMVQNLALGVFPLIAGALRETKDTHLAGFHVQTLFFFLISCILVSLSIFLKVADLLSGSKLDVKDFRKQYLTKILKEDIDEE